MTKGAQLIKEWRTGRGMTQYDLGVACGLSPSTAGARISTYEAGKCIPDPSRLAKIEDVTGVPMRAWTERLEQDQAKAS